MTEEQNNNEEANTETTDTNTGEDQNTDNTDNNDSQDTEDTIDEVEPTSFDYDLILDEEEDSSNDDASDDEDNPKPKAKKGNKAVDALNKMRINGAVKDGINDFFNQNPEAKQYKDMVEKFVNHKQRMKFIKNGLPVSAVIAEALAPHQQRLGALKVKAADAEANRTKDGGSNPPAKPAGGTDFNKMSSKEILKLGRSVMNGQYKG